MTGTADPVWWVTVSAFASVLALTVAVAVPWDWGGAGKRQQTSDISDARKRLMEAGWKGESAVMTEWWRRALWAMEASASTNDRMYSYGTAILGVLARNTQAGSEEKALFDAVWRGSFTKMQDQEIEKLIGEYQAAGRRREKEPRVGYLPEPEPESNRVGTANRSSALGSSGIEAGDLRSYSGADDPGHGPWVFRTMRREILAARLKVILDEQLNRDTSPLVQSLALMRLPTIVDSHAGGSDGEL